MTFDVEDALQRYYNFIDTNSREPLVAKLATSMRSHFGLQDGVAREYSQILAAMDACQVETLPPANLIMLLDTIDALEEQSANT